jgi:plasmid maintenance system antidote protein VapI
MKGEPQLDKFRKLLRSQFEQDFSGVHRVVKAELQREFGTPPAQATNNRARALGLFVQVSAARLGLTHDDFAKSARIEIDTARTLLYGDLPATAYTDDLISRVAQTIGYTPDFLRALLGRSRSNDEAPA